MGEAALKYVGQILGSNAYSCILHSNDCLRFLLFQFQGNCTVCRSKEKCVVAEIFQRNTQPIWLSLDKNILYRQVKPEGQSRKFHIREVGVVEIPQIAVKTDHF